MTDTRAYRVGDTVRFTNRWADNAVARVGDVGQIEAVVPLDDMWPPSAPYVQGVTVRAWRTGLETGVLIPRLDWLAPIEKVSDDG
jgi:uncharacterized RmlC-like cupin family protein